MSRTFHARQGSICAACNVKIDVGNPIAKNWAFNRWVHEACKTAKPEGAPVPAPVPVTVNGSGSVEIENALRAFVQSVASKSVDAETVEKLIDEKVDQKLKALPIQETRRIEIVTDDKPPVKFEIVHPAFETLLKMVSMRTSSGHRPNVYLHGPAGSGKSTGAYQVSKALSTEYGYTSLNPQTPESRLLGYMHAGGQYVTTEFRKRYEFGGTFCLDEIDNASASLVTTLNSLLENGHGAFPDGIVKRHPDFICVCTANTIGRGGDIRYPERRALDSAFLDRFLFLEWNYDEAMTKSIVTQIIGPEPAEILIANVRDYASPLQAHHPSLVVSPRAFIRAAEMQSAGFSWPVIAHAVVSRGVK